MNALLAMALIAVSLTAIGTAFFLWTQTSPGPDVTGETDTETESTGEPAEGAEREEEPDGRHT